MSDNKTAKKPSKKTSTEIYPQEKTVNISQITPNEKNPRVIKDEKFKKLVQSLKDFPDMATARPLVVNTDLKVLGGNMRLHAMKELGWKKTLVKIVDWPEKQQQEFIIKDNNSFGEWDWDVLANEWDVGALDAWGVDVPNFGDRERVGVVNDIENEEWVGMPEFQPAEKPAQLNIRFDNEEMREKFIEKFGIKVRDKGSEAWGTWWPYRDKDDRSSLKMEPDYDPE